MIRRRTFWFHLTAWGFGRVRPREHHKEVLYVRTMRGVWGEWW